MSGENDKKPEQGTVERLVKVFEYRKNAPVRKQTTEGSVKSKSDIVEQQIRANSKMSSMSSTKFEQEISEQASVLSSKPLSVSNPSTVSPTFNAQSYSHGINGKPSVKCRIDLFEKFARGNEESYVPTRSTLVKRQKSTQSSTNQPSSSSNSKLKQNSYPPSSVYITEFTQRRANQRATPQTSAGKVTSSISSSSQNNFDPVSKPSASQSQSKLQLKPQSKAQTQAQAQHPPQSNSQHPNAHRVEITSTYIPVTAKPSTPQRLSEFKMPHGNIPPKPVPPTFCITHDQCPARTGISQKPPQKPIPPRFCKAHGQCPARNFNLQNL